MGKRSQGEKEEEKTSQREKKKKKMGKRSQREKEAGKKHLRAAFHHSFPQNYQFHPKQLFEILKFK